MKNMLEYVIIYAIKPIQLNTYEYIWVHSLY